MTQDNKVVNIHNDTGGALPRLREIAIGCSKLQDIARQNFTGDAMAIISYDLGIMIAILQTRVSMLRAIIPSAIRLADRELLSEISYAMTVMCREVEFLQEQFTKIMQDMKIGDAAG